jgi:hypothetical protein
MYYHSSSHLGKTIQDNEGLENKKKRIIFKNENVKSIK